MADPRLKTKLASGEFFMAPGVFDMMSLLMANRVGFDAVYASGFWLTASYLGIPDAGLATFTDMENRVRRVVDLSDAPVIADADTGYGGLLNLRHTVQGYERAGVSGIQFEDQVFPKKCGHVAKVRTAPVDEMLARLGVALEARSDENMLIIGRTDARSGLGLDEAIKRAKAYADIGVDVVFVEALESVEEMQRVCDEIDAPLMANMVHTGITPMCTGKQLAEMGYATAIYPALLPQTAMHAMDSALQMLKQGDSYDEMPLFNFQEFCKMIGFDDVYAFEERWSQAFEKS